MVEQRLSEALRGFGRWSEVADGQTAPCPLHEGIQEIEYELIRLASCGVVSDQQVRQLVALLRIAADIEHINQLASDIATLHPVSSFAPVPDDISETVSHAIGLTLYGLNQARRMMKEGSAANALRS